MDIAKLDEKIPFLPLVNSAKLVSKIKTIPEEMWSMGDGEIKMRAAPTKGEYLMKTNFWNAIREVESGHTDKLSVSMVDIYRGLTRVTFDNMLKSQFKVAWLMRPLIPFEEELEVLTTRMTERLWEIAEMPIRKKVRVKKDVIKNDKIKMEYGYETKYDVKAAELILKAYKEIADRAKGMAVQRTMIAQVSSHNNNESHSKDMQELDERIAKLQSNVGNSGTVIEAEEAGPTDSSGEEART